MHAVDAEQRPVDLVAAAVELGQRVGDPPDRQLDPGRGVDPGQRDHARARRDGRAQHLDDRVLGRGGRVVVELNLTERGPRAGRLDPQRLVGRGEIVLARQQLLVGSDGKSVVEQAKPHRRAVGQGDVGRRAAEVVGGRAQDRRLEPRAALLQVVDRILVQAPAVALDRLADRGRVRGQVEPAHVDPVARELELVAQGAPVVGRGRLVGERGRGRGREQAGADQQAGPDEQIAAVHRGDLTRAFHAAAAAVSESSSVEIRDWSGSGHTGLAGDGG